MKRIMSMGIAFCLIFSLILSIPVTTNALNDVQLNIGGSISKVAYSQEGTSEIISIFTSNTQVLNKYIIAPEGSIKHYRLCFEIANASVPQTIKFDVNKGSVGQVRLANMTNPTRTNVVVEISKKPDYTLEPSKDGKSLVLTIKGASTATPAPSSTPSATPTPKPSTTPTPSPSSTPKASSTPKPSSTPVPSTTPVSSGNGSITKNGPLSWSMSGDSCIITLQGTALSQTDNENVPRLQLREKEKIIQITIPGKDTRFTDGFLSGNDIINGILINYSPKTNNTIIRISYKNTITYTHVVSNGSSVITVKKGSGTAPSATPTPTPKPSATPSPSASPTATPSSTPVVTPSPSSTPSGGISNLVVGNGENGVVLRLVSPNIVARYRQYSSDIVIDDKTNDEAITFMIPVSIVNLGNGTTVINNSFIKSAVSYSTLYNSYLMINKASTANKFKIIEGSNVNELLIVLDSSGNGGGSTGKKLVVLDPGHGGSDPGGTVGNYYEKFYNLDIALKCEAILKSRGVNVEMTRRTDVFVSLDGRAEFANERNAALFVSIHNNIMPSGYKGTMALYYPSSYYGKAYAQLIKDNLVKDLGTRDLGLKGNGNLVVVRKTKMPAVLAEIACMSDSGDLALLNTESFRQKAAESLANSIIQILNSM